ncbi:HET-domain-containing protein, partial [Hyaloscypha variabilis F]
MPPVPPKEARGGPSECACWKLHNYCDLTTCSEARPSTKAKSIRAGEGYEDLFQCTWAYLMESIHAGCSTCEMMRQIVRRGASAFTFEGDQQRRGQILNGYRSNGSLIIRFDGSIEIKCRQLASSNCRALPTGSFESCATGTSLAFEQCRKWVSDCSQNHAVCCVGNTVLPRRVVDIGHMGEHKFSPRLIESDNHVGEYSALSHCWGSSDLLKTTTGTLADRKLSIPWDSLSKTFRDAIIVTHELGLRYIWIDSLCIIQDKFADWDTESKNMGAIYGNSKVTIAAVKSKDGTGGLFQEDGKVVSFTHKDVNTSMDTSVAIRKCHTHSGYEASIDADSQPLFARGWTLQEELLAPRVLYYGSEEIVFQCRELTDCQCGMIHKEAVTQKRVYERARKETSNSELMYHWAKLVSKYTTRFLTIETDRFPAISGLTSAFENQGLGEYVAGLWTKDLSIWLAWRPKRGKRTDVYVAPSWSWASLAG